MTSRPKPKGWHPEDIKAELRKRLGPITLLAEAWGYNRSIITGVLRHPRFSQPVELRIARALDEQPHTLWPDRWHPDGSPKPRANGRDRNSRSRNSNSQNEEAA